MRFLGFELLTVLIGSLIPMENITLYFGVFVAIAVVTTISSHWIVDLREDNESEAMSMAEGAEMTIRPASQ
jgi:hypothetical protein